MKTSFYKSIENVKTIISDLEINHAALLKEEAAKLLISKESLPELEYMSLERNIFAKRALREESIAKVKKIGNEFESKLELYLNKLKAKSRDAIALRYKKASSFRNREAETTNKNPVINVVRYSDGSGGVVNSMMNYTSSFNIVKNFPAVFTLLEKPELKNDMVISKYSYSYDDYFNKVVYPGNWDFNGLVWQSPGVQASLLSSILNKGILSSSEQNESPIPIKFTKKNAKLLQYFKNVGPIPKNLQAYMTVVHACYPFLNAYLANKEKYPYFIDFGENVPWPNSEQMNAAVLKWMGLGTKEYAQANIEVLKIYSEYALRENAHKSYYIKTPSNTKLTQANIAFNKYDTERAPEPHYGVPKVAASFNFDQWLKYSQFKSKTGTRLPSSITDATIEKIKTETRAFNKANPSNAIKEYYKNSYYNEELPIPPRGSTTDSIRGTIKSVPFISWPYNTKMHVANNTVDKWYWPRPKSGYIYVPGFDYINPALWTDSYLASSTSRYSINEARREWNKNMLKISGDLREFSKDYTEFMEVSLAVGAAVLTIYTAGAAGGVYAAIGTAVATALSYTELGEDEFGRFLITVAQAVTVGGLTDAAMDVVIEEVVVKEIQRLAIKEAGKITGLDDSVIGRLVINVAGNAAVNMYKSDDMVDAFIKSADKSWKLEAAKANPYAAILLAGSDEIDSSSFDLSSLNPMNILDNLSWDGLTDSLKKKLGEIKGKDIGMLVGLGIMINSGRMTPEQAALYMAQSASINKIKKFKDDQPMLGPQTRYSAAMKEVNRYKRTVLVMDKVARGGVPTREEIGIISDNVASPLYDKIKELGLPMKAEVSLWDVAINDIGLPNLAQYVPDINFTIPEFLVSKEAQVGWINVSKKEIEESLGKDLTKSIEFTKDDFINIIVNLLPRNTPLIVPTRVNQLPSFNNIDVNGNLTIRKKQSFAFDHPMLKSGIIKKVLNKNQKAYMIAREAEILKVKEELINIERQQEERQENPNQMG